MISNDQRIAERKKKKKERKKKQAGDLIDSGTKILAYASKMKSKRKEKERNY